ncbi:MAG TPA: bifunctional phosphoribosylaminoimidazolecarboxamide formyltransferase/IMP cyclohydrolase, partial [Rhodospirillales bacterium]|nr:bifunctional phosphoribosylaminoimidazolecarboxamide formyltransferase/IMP cyclohydrolase [Rhodospirillales bacterium]
MDIQPIRRALLSVSDKTGILELARFLVERGVELVSTGGTARLLAEAGLPVTEAGNLTGFGEFLDGRVKTLHPAIHAGLLARRDRGEHLAELDRREIAPIDLLVVNLYPFEETLATGATFDACIEQIDIGGPAMIRAAAKNHAFVTVVVDPADYAGLMTAIGEKGGTDLATRRRLARKAFARTAAYDAAIATWLAGETGEFLPERLPVAGRRASELRYGENPHQKAALYAASEHRPGVVGARQLQGKALSYNNILDADAAFELVAEFADPALVIVKHNNPCGVAEGSDPLDVWRRALACDPVSAFGGIVAFNRPLEADLAEELAKIFLEVVIAPEIRPEAAAVLAARRNLRVLETGGLPEPESRTPLLRSVAGGFLAQERDAGTVDAADLRRVTARAPTEAELRDLLFAWKVAKHVRSNAIVLARGRATVGIGAGQMSRVDAVEIAVRKAESQRGARPCVVASDAFFPFPDGLVAAIEAGA